jgi:[protein-PII] uridylyltransferase
MATLLEKIEASAAARLSLAPHEKPSGELARYKNFLKVESHRLKILHRAGGSGLEICHARAAILDVLLRYILVGVRAHSSAAGGVPMSSMALVAIGGYGRAELNPFSDIDIMFLHDAELLVGGKPHPALKEMTDGVLYTLWDIGLKVGHSVRSIEHCVAVANADMQSKTSLIEARLIEGSPSLFERLERVLLAKCVMGHEDEYIQARLDDQGARRAKFGNSPLMQEPNIKNGCGGLRDYQNLVWMTFFKYRTRSLADLQQKEMVGENERKQLEAAYDFLLRVRNELHYHVNRAADVLSKSVQPSVALNLGFSERSPSARLENFMRDFYTHSRNIDLITRTVEQRLALVPELKFLSSFRQIIRQRRQTVLQKLIDGFKFLDGEIYPISQRIFRDQPRRLMRVFLYAQQRGFRLHPDLAQLIRNSLALVDNSFLRDAHVRETFLQILSQRGNVAPILRAMHEVGFLGKFLPEFGKLTCLVQHEFYHQYTADEHTLVCIGQLDKIADAKEPPHKAYTELFHSVERPFILYLALLLHDAGKAYASGHHEELGGQLAVRVAKRLGLDGATAHALRLLIENHLVMAVTSQRRDLDDDAVIRNFAGQIQQVENLKMLTLHTFVDSMGTSDKLWNSFKETLLWTLYHRTFQVLAGATDFIRAEEKQRELLAEEVHRIMPDSFSDEELRAHFDNLPPRYFQIHAAREILSDLTLVHRFMHRQLSEKDEALTPVITWHNEADRGYTLVNVCTWDRAGLFSKICGCLTATGLNILAAEIMTRTDGIVLDTFFVTDAATGHLARREERDKFEAMLDRVMTGEELDLSALIAKQKRAMPPYQSPGGERIPTVIQFDNATSETRTVIDVETEDRMGLLYSISTALHELDLDLSLAKIVTEKGAAIDSFYVAEPNGEKISDAGRQSFVERKLRFAIDVVK